eukprot:scaffold5572_cov147-Pinguiococcus_pyrenoidosus.AAC.1
MSQLVKSSQRTSGKSWSGILSGVSAINFCFYPRPALPRCGFGLITGSFFFCRLVDCKPKDELLNTYFSTEFVVPGTKEWGRPPWARK